MSARILVTAANGQLGRLVIDALLAEVPAPSLAATVRSAEAAARLSARGVTAHIADYAESESFDKALDGVDRLLLISSNTIGQRAVQHGNVIKAGKRAGIKLIAYTSVLHADTSALGLAEEHRQTEAALAASSLPFVLLRNGWYTENYTAALPSILAQGAVFGSAGQGRTSSASRADYAAAAAAVLMSSEDQAGRVYELAGDKAYTLSEFSAEVTRQTGKTIVYKDLPEAEYKAALIGAGLPEPVAALLSDSSAAAGRGALFDDSRQLSGLIGRSTTPLAETVAESLRA